MISISHKIELKPNNKQKTYFRKAFGCSRLAYNWGLAEWERRRKEGVRIGRPSIFARELRAEFNAIKKEKFPFVYEVTKFATMQPFEFLGKAYDNFFKKLGAHPQFKKRRDNQGSFYIGGDQVHLSDENTNSKQFKELHKGKSKRQYLKVPNLGCVKMAERVRFDLATSKINNVTISQDGNKFYASFSLMITEEEFLRTHPAQNRSHAEEFVGIDLGVSHAMVLSNGVTIENPRPLKKKLKRIERISRQLSRRVHPKTKEERRAKVQKSNNYRKLSVKLANMHRKVANVRNDFAHKLTTILTTHFAKIGMEDLNVAEMVERKRKKVYNPNGQYTDEDGRRFDYHKMKKKMTQSVLDVSFGKLCLLLDYKAERTGASIVRADQKVQRSSQTCSNCGHVDPRMKNVWRRVYECENCGAVFDRDYNAAINLLGLVYDRKIGVGYPESKPADLTRLLDRLARNGIKTGLLKQESNISQSL